MAQNRLPEHDPTNSSSEEEEEGSSSEEASEAESEKPENNSSPPPTPPVTKNTSLSSKKTPIPPSDSDSESGSDSESKSGSDSDLPPKKINKPDPNIKPISSRPMEDNNTTPKKPRSVKTPSSPPPEKSITGGKRPAPESEVKDSKKAKKKENGDDSKKQLFQRLWSEDDEIVILKGMIDYTEKKGTDPFADLNDFHNFIKKSLHVDVTKAQLSAKVRRLKQKYENNSIREKKGKVRSFSNPHEKRGYELSKKIWGSTGSGGSGEGNSEGVKSKKVIGTPRKNKSQSSSKAVVNGVDVQKEVLTVEFEQNVKPSPSVVQLGKIGVPISEEEIIKDGLELLAGDKRVELEEKWKELKVQEMELYLKRVELIQAQTKLVLDVIKSNDK